MSPAGDVEKVLHVPVEILDTGALHLGSESARGQLSGLAAPVGESTNPEGVDVEFHRGRAAGRPQRPRECDNREAVAAGPIVARKISAAAAPPPPLANANPEIPMAATSPITNKACLGSSQRCRCSPTRERFTVIPRRWDNVLQCVAYARWWGYDEISA